jgi:hypothetical protein
MALEGNLTDFGLSEILQLIAVQQKSGMLSISSDDRSMVLFFRNGKVISTRDRRRKGRDPLKDYLVRYGVITHNGLLRIMNISTQSKLDLTEIIVSENFLTDEEMRKHYRNQIQEAIHEILTWQQCSYKFIPGRDVTSGLKIWGEYSIEGMLMESMRRIDEFPQISSEFPDKKMIIARTRAPEPDTKLSTNEKTILEMLQEERTLYYLIGHARMPLFETYETLKHLKEKELIKTFSETPSEEKEKAAAATRKPGFQDSLKRLLPVSILAIFFLTSFLIGSKQVVRSLKNPSFFASASFQNNLLQRNRVEERMRWLLEAYRASKGSYPRDLDTLKKAGLATDSFMSLVNRYSFRYHLTPGENAYTLL